MSILAEKLKRYASMCALISGIVSSVVILTKSYYTLTMNMHHIEREIKNVNIDLNTLDLNLDKLIIEVAILKHQVKN